MTDDNGNPEITGQSVAIPLKQRISYTGLLDRDIG